MNMKNKDQRRSALQITHLYNYLCAQCVLCVSVCATIYCLIFSYTVTTLIRQTGKIGEYCLVQ